MTIHALAAGKLFGTPEQRTSKNGTRFTKATLLVVASTERQFVTLFAFSQSAQDELERLGEGDSLSVQGQLKAEVFERDGRSRVSLSMTVDHVLALRQPPRERKPKPDKPRERWAAPTRAERPHVDDDLNDSVPF
ncbi:MAG: single-stranded DNA-binding protein [Methylocystis sp.]